MIDLHSHLIPGVDDGSRSMEQSVDTLRRFVEHGITDVAVTPHLRAAEIPGRGEARIEQRDRLLAELRGHAPDGIRLHPGFEIMLDAPLDGRVFQDRRYALAESRYYLVEFPVSVGGGPAVAALSQVLQGGATPLVAHPERYHACTLRDFRSWAALGAVLQVDATVITRPTPRGDMGRQLLEQGIAALLAADNHGDKRSLATGRRWLEDRGAGDAAEWLTTENPKAVLEDRPVTAFGPMKFKRGLRERVQEWLRNIERWG